MIKQTEALKLAIEVFDGNWHDEIVDTDWADKANNALTVMREALEKEALHKLAAESLNEGLRLDDWDKIGCVNHDCDQCKAQQEPLTDIYRSFEQWKNGNVLEHGVPRTEYYSEAQLDLVEMGWKYGYDAGLAEQPAQQEWIETACALIKAADDAAADRDYMLDSNDCIRVLRGEWKGDFLNDMPKQPTPQAQPAREWVGLTNEEIDYQAKKDDHAVYFALGALWAEAKLKEKNT